MALITLFLREAHPDDSTAPLDRAGASSMPRSPALGDAPGTEPAEPTEGTAPNAVPAAPSLKGQVPPLIVDSLRDSWTMCKATSKLLGTKTVWRLGIASSILSAVTATTVFATLQSDPSEWAKAAVAAAVMLSAALTAAQTWHVGRRDGLVKSRNQLHGLHQSLEQKIFEVRFRGGEFEPGYDSEVAAAYAAIDTDSIPTDGGRWDAARREVRVSMRSELDLE